MAKRKPRFLYLFTANLTHPGLRIKFSGQCKALSKQYRVSTLSYFFPDSSNIFTKLFYYLLFECKAPVLCLITPTIYVRYNPKSLLTNFSILILSFFKTIYLEHNTLYEAELKVLNRGGELWLHRAWMGVFRFSKLTHLAVFDDIAIYLKQKGITNTKRMMNGYTPPETPAGDIQQNLIKEVSTIRKKVKTLGIFVGHATQWIGSKEMLTFFQKYPDIHVIVASPKKDKNNETLTFLGPCSPATLSEIYKVCDFGLGHFSKTLETFKSFGPLKTREYLCHGLPILVKHHDTLESIEDLRPYIFNLKRDNNAIEKLLKFKGNKLTLSSQARMLLSWEKVLKNTNIL